jgi:hypothetical protein
MSCMLVLESARSKVTGYWVCQFQYYTNIMMDIGIFCGILGVSNVSKVGSTPYIAQNFH